MRGLNSGRREEEEEEQSCGGGSGWMTGLLGTGVGVGLGIASLYLLKSEQWPMVAHALRHRTLELDELDEMEELGKEKQRRELTSRERRFLRFASLESTGTIYMTPRDFLDSVTQEQPRHRFRRAEVSEKEIQAWLRKTPTIRKSSPRFLRDLDAHGLISFAEYLFLLSVLTKPRSGFNIAFNMFDMDGNQKVDKQEFLVIRALLTALRRSGKVFSSGDYLENEEAVSPALLAANTRLQRLQALQSSQPSLLEEILSRGKEGRQGGLASDDEERRRSQPNQGSGRDGSGLASVEEVPDTTLLVHFFGQSGGGSLAYEDFSKFYDNLQTEVLEMEFAEFSRGKPDISETDFARILLRYTLLHIDDYQAYLSRIQQRLGPERGISLQQFQFFCKFLNHMDDFAIAMRMFALADQPVSKKEFARAVQVSTGFALEEHVIDTVFTIFDANGDGSLSYSEFIAVMKDRIHRGFRSHLVKQSHGWDSFKSCVREEMKTT